MWIKDSSAGQSCLASTHWYVWCSDWVNLQPHVHLMWVKCRSEHHLQTVAVVGHIIAATQGLIEHTTCGCPNPCLCTALTDIIHSFSLNMNEGKGSLMGRLMFIVHNFSHFMTVLLYKLQLVTKVRLYRQYQYFTWENTASHKYVLLLLKIYIYIR